MVADTVDPPKREYVQGKYVDYLCERGHKTVRFHFSNKPWEMECSKSYYNERLGHYTVCYAESLPVDMMKARLAQQAEHLTSNQKATGSKPVSCSSKEGTMAATKPEPDYWDDEFKSIKELKAEQENFEPPRDTDLVRSTYWGVPLDVWQTAFAFFPVSMDGTERVIWLQRYSVQYDRVKGNGGEYTRRYIRPYHPRVKRSLFFNLGIRKLVGFITFFCVASQVAGLFIYGIALLAEACGCKVN